MRLLFLVLLASGSGLLTSVSSWEGGQALSRAAFKAFQTPSSRFRHPTGIVARAAAAKFDDSPLDVSGPVGVRPVSAEEGNTMLEWPSLEKSKKWSERYDGGEVFYVLEGSASVSVSTFLNGEQGALRFASPLASKCLRSRDKASYRLLN